MYKIIGDLVITWNILLRISFYVSRRGRSTQSAPSHTIYRWHSFKVWCKM